MSRNFEWYSFPNRSVCDCLTEMRALLKTMNDVHPRSTLITLVEEVQTYANRMESALEDASDIRQLYIKRSELKKELKELKAKVEELENDS